MNPNYMSKMYTKGITEHKNIVNVTWPNSYHAGLEDPGSIPGPNEIFVWPTLNPVNS